MRIAFVTATGADDKTDISEMAKLSSDFSIEWGILVSKRSQGTPRFPSYQWIEELSNSSLYCAGHLCGGYVHGLLSGKSPWLLPRESIYAGINLITIFQRYQINFHGINYALDDLLLINALRTMPLHLGNSRPTLVIQMDGVNDFRLNDVKQAGFEAVPLFDVSHGGGVLPEVWPAPIGFSGYAGGLTPYNVSEQLKKIADVVGDGTIWIDAETGLRNDDDQFDLSLVRRFVENAQHYF